MRSSDTCQKNQRKTRCLLLTLLAIFLSALQSAGASAEKPLGSHQIPALGVAAPANYESVVMPDGKGLPKGSGDVDSGATIYARTCASCHGSKGEKAGVPLVGGRGTLDSKNPIKTVGSYWPYASTVYDYVYRAMPFGEAQSLTHDETYQVVAYILNMSDVIDDEFVLSNETIGSVKMPNQNGFMLPDPRPDGQLASAPCMQNCRVSTKIIGRARIIDVTPDK